MIQATRRHFAEGLLVAVCSAMLMAANSAAAGPEIRYPGNYYGRVDLPLPQSLGHLEKLIGDTDNFEPIKNFSANNRYRIAAKPIGRLDLLLRKGGKKVVSVCTGWLISDDLMVTNHHCIPGNREDGFEVISASLLMNYLQEGDTGGVERFKVDLRPIETDPALDYTIVRVDGNPGRKYGTVPLGARDPEGREELFIIQHPAGKAKRLARRNCRADKATERPEEIRHFCDTLGGSSGAPVFSDNDMALVGLHFAGIQDQVNFAKRMTAILARSKIMSRLLGAAAPPPPSSSPPADGEGGWQAVQ